jgi:hypothetical protein
MQSFSSVNAVALATGNLHKRCNTPTFFNPPTMAGPISTTSAGRGPPAADRFPMGRDIEQMPRVLAAATTNATLDCIVLLGSACGAA